MKLLTCLLITAGLAGCTYQSGYIDNDGAWVAKGTPYAMRTCHSAAALVPGPPRLDSCPNPDLLCRQLLVEQRLLFRLRLQRRFLAHQKGLVVAGPVEQPGPVHLDDAVCQPLQKRAIVRDEQQRQPFPH